MHEYFESYTEKQLEWSEQWGEEFSMYALEDDPLPFEEDPEEFWSQPEEFAFSVGGNSRGVADKFVLWLRETVQRYLDEKCTLCA